MNTETLFSLDIPKEAHHLVWKALKEDTTSEKLSTLKCIAINPALYLDEKIWGEFAAALVAIRERQCAEEARNAALYNNADSILSEFVSLPDDSIEDGARKQYENAKALPFIKSIALMPDAHQGYGIPIGTVLSVKGAIIPNAVGVDIGCQMHLSILPVKFTSLPTSMLRHILESNTYFGFDHRPESNSTIRTPSKRFLDYLKTIIKSHPFLNGFEHHLLRQLGTSGGGNHFVELGIFESEDRPDFNGNLAIMSHSGSRRFGATIANHFNKLAISQLPEKYREEFKDLAWLHADSQEGKDYFHLHTMALNYAFCCHGEIHMALAQAIQNYCNSTSTPLAPIDFTKSIAHVWSPHNYVEKTIDGFYVHRKGANDLKNSRKSPVIIPGSMVSKSYVVKAKETIPPQWLDSCSHGAGRAMSRTKGIEFGNANPTKLQSALDSAGVVLIGGGHDEAPWNYKDIETVMEAQKDTFDIIGSFQPKIVRMADDTKTSRNTPDGE